MSIGYATGRSMGARNRASVRFVIGIVLSGLVASCMAGCAGPGRDKPSDGMGMSRLTYRDAPYVVTAGERWRLSWASPHRAGDIHPAYDVRVVSGTALLGEEGALRASAYAETDADQGPLDLMATGDRPVTVWLEAGATFYLANDFISVCRTQYRMSADAP